MKVIQPLNIWVNGQSKVAIYFNLTSYYDDIQTYADFVYQLYDENMELVAMYQPLRMEGDVYNNWTDNNYAYDWAASLLNLVIINDYTTTTTTTTTSSTSTTTTIAPETTTTTTTTTTFAIRTDTTTTTTTQP